MRGMPATGSFCLACIDVLRGAAFTVMIDLALEQIIDYC
jgi:hypothetical protein